jgi:glutaredoxin
MNFARKKSSGSSTPATSTAESVIPSSPLKTAEIVRTLEENKKYVVIVGIIAALALIVAIAAYMNEGFANMTGLSKFREYFRSSDIADLDVVLFMSPTCDWSKKTMAVFEKEGTLKNVTVVDVTTENGAKVATMYGATKGLPSFLSRKYNVGTVGFRDSTAEVVSELKKMIDEVKQQKVPQFDKVEPVKSENFNSGPEEAEDPLDFNSIKKMGIILFHRDGCGYCTKAKADLDNLGLGEEYVKRIDVTTSEGSQALRDFDVKEGGVPVYASIATGKHTVGYEKLSNIIEKLS